MNVSRKVRLLASIILVSALTGLLFHRKLEVYDAFISTKDCYEFTTYRNCSLYSGECNTVVCSDRAIPAGTKIEECFLQLKQVPKANIDARALWTRRLAVGKRAKNIIERDQIIKSTDLLPVCANYSRP